MIHLADKTELEKFVKQKFISLTGNRFNNVEFLRYYSDYKFFGFNPVQQNQLHTHHIDLIEQENVLFFGDFRFRTTFPNGVSSSDHFTLFPETVERGSSIECPQFYYYSYMKDESIEHGFEVKSENHLFSRFTVKSTVRQFISIDFDGMLFKFN